MFISILEKFRLTPYYTWGYVHIGDIEGDTCVPVTWYGGVWYGGVWYGSV